MRQNVEVETFVDDDGGFVAWMASHPDGYVLNTSRKPTSAYIRLHRVGCPTISGLPANGVNWTVNYAKRCGTRPELEEWASSQLGGEVWACPQCD